MRGSKGNTIFDVYDEDFNLSLYFGCVLEKENPQLLLMAERYLKQKSIRK
jgi:hypothetical protein